MSYLINELAKLSGVSTRTLRYYDEIGLLKPARVDSNGYRIYEQEQVDMLQHILFYRELGVSLTDINTCLTSECFEKTKVLESHLAALQNKKRHIERLIENIEHTILSEKGENSMSNEEKFKVFKNSTIDKNEEVYGQELRAKYGDKEIDASKNKMKSMNQKGYDHMMQVINEMNETLKEAYTLGDPSSDSARKVCALHQELLEITWAEGSYTKEGHLALVEGFVEDERFVSYYDKIAEGSVTFLRDATVLYCKKS